MANTKKCISLSPPLYGTYYFQQSSDSGPVLNLGTAVTVDKRLKHNKRIRNRLFHNVNDVLHCWRVEFLTLSLEKKINKRPPAGWRNPQNTSQTMTYVDVSFFCASTTYTETGATPQHRARCAISWSQSSLSCWLSNRVTHAGGSRSTACRASPRYSPLSVNMFARPGQWHAKLNQPQT